MDNELEALPLAHRTGLTSAAGKCDSRLEIPMPQEMRDLIGALAVLDGISAAEWTRNEIEKLLYGHVVIMRRSVNRKV